MLSALIGILIIVVIGAICFWAIEKFVRDGRLANLLKLLVADLLGGNPATAPAAGGNRLVLTVAQHDA